MKDKFVKKLVKPQIVFLSLLTAVLICVLSYYNWPVAIIAAGVFLAVILIELKNGKKKRNSFNEYIENLTSEMSRKVADNIEKSPLHVCITDSRGIIEWHNTKFREWFPETENLMYKDLHQLIPKFKIEEVLDRSPDDPPILVTVKDRYYRVQKGEESEAIQPETFQPASGDAEEVPEEDAKANKRYTFYFFDVTNLENLKKLHRDEKSCAMMLYVDNYEDLINATPEDNRSKLAGQIETKIRQFAQKNQAAITRTASDKYYIVLDNKHLDNLIENKFGILDEIREIESSADFPVSLSIGVGAQGKDFLANHESAQAAMEMALGRGGDQAVVKKINDVKYFGGRLQTVEKRNKGRSRIVGHALKRMIEQSSGVMIMGHKRPDMDCFGAAVGLYALVKKCNRPAAIVLDSVGESLRALYEYVKYNGDYQIMNPELALTNASKDILVIVVDTHSPSYLCCPELLKKTDKVVIIDHHRKMAGGIENATLTYMESYASSACELVTEIVQSVGEKGTLSRVDAEALLAGITLDTKHFASQTGVRTFEAATFLRRVGADMAKVRGFFQVEEDLFRVKAEAILHAELIKLGPDTNLAITSCKGAPSNIGLVIAQTADEMLTIKGVKAAVVLGENTKREIMVSARSIGDINVQVLMERLGGGGHFNVAGAQVKTGLEETEAQLKEIINEELLGERKK